MKYKTLVIERGVRGGRFNKPLTLRVPERQNMAEKKLLQYILESLSRRSRLVPFALKNFSTMEVARHLLFNRTGSQLTLYGYIDTFNCFCRWVKAEPDQLMNKCRDRNGDANPKGIARMTSAIDEYIDQLQAKNLAPATIRSRLKSITSIFRINGVGLKLPYGLSVRNLYDERAPSREELIKILDLADLRERVIITMLAVSGLRIGTLLKLQYRHVKGDLERGIIPIHIHVEAELTKGKRRSYDTFLNEEASEYLKFYLDARKNGRIGQPPEFLNDESPLISNYREIKPLAAATIQDIVSTLYIRAGVLTRNPKIKRYDLRAHSLRKFFLTQMISTGTERDYVEYMMGHTLSVYHDVKMKGVDFLRGIYLASGMSIQPRNKASKILDLIEIIRSWELDPKEILTHEALNHSHRVDATTL